MRSEFNSIEQSLQPVRRLHFQEPRPLHRSQVTEDAEEHAGPANRRSEEPDSRPAMREITIFEDDYAVAPPERRDHVDLPQILTNDPTNDFHATAARRIAAMRRQYEEWRQRNPNRRPGPGRHLHPNTAASRATHSYQSHIWQTNAADSPSDATSIIVDGVSTQLVRSSDDKSCWICMMEYAKGDEMAILPCAGRHRAHLSCLKEWHKKNFNCPVCRQDFSWKISVA